MTTVVFADIVGSTSMFERLGDETASRFVTQLVGALSQIFEQHSGRVVKLLGDGLFVVFPHEGDALAACISIQKRFLDKPIRPGGSGAPVQMQMGMESGEVVEIDGDCFGDTVNSAARLADQAGAAQILTTQSVWAALGTCSGFTAQSGFHALARQGRSQSFRSARHSRASVIQRTPRFILAIRAKRWCCGAPSVAWWAAGKSVPAVNARTAVR